MLKRQARDDGKETEDKKENEQEEPEEPPEGTGGQYEKEVDPLAEPRRQSRKADGLILHLRTLLKNLKCKKIHLGYVEQDLETLTADKIKLDRQIAFPFPHYVGIQVLTWDVSDMIARCKVHLKSLINFQLIFRPFP